MSEDVTFDQVKERLMKGLERPREYPSWELLDYGAVISALYHQDLIEDETALEEMQAFGRELMQVIKDDGERGLKNEKIVNKLILQTYNGFFLFMDD